MPSAARTLANRANAALSTGPVTPQGKTASARNSPRHGLTANTVVLNSEDQSAYDQLRDSLMRHYNPSGEVEREMVEMLAQNKWRLNRLRRVEAAFLDQAVTDVQAQNPGVTADEAIAILFLDDAHARRMRLFLRYQAPVEKAYNKTLRDLEITQKVRTQTEKHRAVENAWAASAQHTGPTNPPAVGFVSQTDYSPELARSASATTSPESTSNSPYSDLALV